MLSKLFKQEWKATWKIPTLILGFLVIITLLSMLSCEATVSLRSIDKYGFISVLFILTFILYILYVCCLCFAILIYFAVRFYRNLYTDEGYLMHTLPVTPRQLILSKGFTMIIWQWLSYLCIFLSVIGMVIYMIYTFNGPIDWSAFGNSLSQFWLEFEYYFKYPWLIIMIYILLMVLGSIAAVCMTYGSISIGQTFKKHKVMASIAAYIAIQSILQSVSSFASIPISFYLQMSSNTFDPSAFFYGTLALQLILILISIIVTYFLTETIMAKKLNLD